MAYVEVDVDLDDFETYELVDAVCKRFRYEVGRKKAITPIQKAELKESIQPLNEILSNCIVSGIEIKSLEDQMKYEHIAKVWHKYSSSQIENLLP